MSTEAKTTVIVKTSPKLVAAVKAQLDAEAKAIGKQTYTARMIRTEAERMSYDEKQARQMTFLAWREAKGFNAAKEGEESTKQFDNDNRFAISKIMTIAFPVETHKADLEKAIAFNEKLGDAKHGRISVSKLESISRGKLTFADAKEGKSAAKNVKQTTPQKVVKLTGETLENELAGIRSRYCKPGLMTPKQMREYAKVVFCDGPYKPAEKTESDDTETEETE